MDRSIDELANKRILVMGLGVNGGGLGVTRFLVERGAEVTVTDLRSEAVLRPTLEALAGLPVRYVLGEHREEDFRTTDIVIRNPGVPRESRFLEIARAAGASVEMEMTLFFRLCSGPILGITGTRGKTTTTMLCYEMIRRFCPEAIIAGNLRVSALEQLSRISSQTPVVLELSSWQLEGLGEAGLSPEYACVTNLSPDHLDRYRSMNDYAAAKREIVGHQQRADVVVLNGDDPVVRTFAVSTPARRVFFGSQLPSNLEGADWVVINNGVLKTTLCTPASRWSRDVPPSADAWQTICTAPEVRLPGAHNLLNIAAASALALSFGVPLPLVREAIQAFEGVADRLEQIRELNGVRFINDTTATTPTALITALHAINAPIVLIAGGADKQLPLDGLAQAITQRAKALVLLGGTGTPHLQTALAPVAAQLPVYGPFDHFAAAVEQAHQLAQPGDVVLLSPGYASFGMFVNEFDRGDQFRQIVQALS